MKRSLPPWRDRFLTAYRRLGWRGFISLRRLLRRPEIEVQTRYGGCFMLHPGDYIDEIVMREGFYESEVFECLQRHFAPGLVFWDIGANFGLHCISAGLHCPALQIVGFEPNPGSYRRLRAHAARNQVEVRCQPEALGARDGNATLHVNESGNPGMTTTTPEPGARFDRQVEIVLARAETLIARGVAPAPNLIKLDVEGGEREVLEGFGRYLSSPDLHAIVLECSPGIVSRPADHPIGALLSRAGFRLRSLVRQENSAHALINVCADRSAP